MSMHIGLAIVVCGIILLAYAHRKTTLNAMLLVGYAGIAVFILGMSIMQHSAWKHGTDGYNSGGEIMRKDPLPESEQSPGASACRAF